MHFLTLPESFNVVSSRFALFLLPSTKDHYLLDKHSIIFLLNREIYSRFHASYNGRIDIHTKLMRKYKDIPSWWFHTILVLSFALSLLLCTVLKSQVQLPWWGLIFACTIALIFTLPISIIQATTNNVSQ